MITEISLLGRAAITGSQYETDGLLIRPSFKFFVIQNTDGEKRRKHEPRESGSVTKDGGRSEIIRNGFVTEGWRE